MFIQIFARSPPMEDVPGNVQLIVRDLIEKGFTKDPQARPSSSELLQHPAFKILGWWSPDFWHSCLHFNIIYLMYVVCLWVVKVKENETPSNTDKSSQPIRIWVWNQRNTKENDGLAGNLNLTLNKWTWHSLGNISGLCKLRLFPFHKLPDIVQHW